MRSPRHQAKLVLFGLLKTASAFAGPSTTKVFPSSAASSGTNALYSAAAASSEFRFPPPRPTQTTTSSSQVTASQKQLIASATATATTLSPPRQKERKTHNHKHPITNSRSTKGRKNIQLRLAGPADVPSLNDCNLQTLPENYNHQFYLHHLREWPDLALVAVLENDIETNENNENPRDAHSLHGNYEPPVRPLGLGHNQNGRWNNSGNPNNSNRFFPSTTKSNTNSNPIVVGYLLGKTLERPQTNSRSGRQPGAPTTTTGHVSSLAVLPNYRRLGLARQLLDQFHAHLENNSKSCAVGLHVRVSNTAAVRLYQTTGYAPVSTIAGYYEDGEDAYYMQKPMDNMPQQQ